MVSVILIILVVLYSVFLFWCRYHWERTKDKSQVVLDKTDVQVTVVVPVRNESHNLPQLIKSLAEQEYSLEKFSVILVDDHSTDHSIDIARNIFAGMNFRNFICISSPGHSKKDAITYAVNMAVDGLILTTDADTTMGKDWIASMVKEWSDSGSMMVCGPVKLMCDDSFVGQLQSLEFTGLSGIAAAGIRSDRPMFCNGANLAFSKKTFSELNGYENSLSFSGDDTQLMLKISDEYPGRISFLKDKRAIVQTNAISRNSDLWQQRRRWASKIPYTLSAFTVSIAVMAWFVHAFLLIQVFNTFFHPEVLLLIFPWVMKIFSEMALLRTAGKFFDSRIPGWIVIVAQPLYAFYIVGVGIIAPLAKFRWKERLVK